MYRLEKIGRNCFYVKIIGDFPPEVVKKFRQEFFQKIEDVSNFSVIVDLLDANFLKISSFDIILEILNKNNEKLRKSAYVIAHNPPLSEELKYLIREANSPKRKIVKNLEGAKSWLGIENIIIRRSED